MRDSWWLTWQVRKESTVRSNCRIEGDWAETTGNQKNKRVVVGTEASDLGVGRSGEGEEVPTCELQELQVDSFVARLAGRKF